MFNENIKIIRERIFFYPDSDGTQEIKDEITILNLTDVSLFSIFLPKKDFMIGLKVFNEENRELVFYPNKFTREYIREDISEGVLSSSYKHSTLLNQIENHEIYLLWIKLPEGEEIKPNQSMILKLHYYSAKKRFVNLSLFKMKF